MGDKKVYDISMTIEPSMPVYKNREEMRPKIAVTSDFKGNQVYQSSISMNLHTGTHIDAPLHMIEGGETADQLSLEQLYRHCKVLDLTGVKDGITDNDLKEAGLEIKEDDFIILKTGNSLRDNPGVEFIFLKSSGADYLLERGVSGVGIDSLGIERAQPGYPTHRSLLSKRVVLLEGLRLKEIEEGEYELILLPLKIKGVEAVPARAFLLSI